LGPAPTAPFFPTQPAWFEPLAQVTASAELTANNSGSSVSPRLEINSFVFMGFHSLWFFSTYIIRSA
jgi:hypothetical protein